MFEKCQEDRGQSIRYLERVSTYSMVIDTCHSLPLNLNKELSHVDLKETELCIMVANAGLGFSSCDQNPGFFSFSVTVLWSVPLLAFSVSRSFTSSVGSFLPVSLTSTASTRLSQYDAAKL